MSDVIEQARARREELAAEMARLDALISQHDGILAELKSTLSPVLAASTAAIRPAPAFASGDTAAKIAGALMRGQNRTRGPNGSRPEAIVDAILETLARHQRPMTRYELIDEVEAAGLTVGGTDKPRNIGTILWRSGLFDNTGKGYWPKDAGPPEPAASPDDDHDPSEIIG